MRDCQQSDRQRSDRQQPDRQQQLSLFAGHAGDSLKTGTTVAQRSAGGGRAPNARLVMINPHLLAARRIAKRMRRLPDRSEAETRAGLAICAQLKAFLADGEPSDSERRTAPH